jgi:hypothetical protein
MSARPGQTQPGRTDVRTGTERIFLHEHEWLDELTAADLHPWPVLPAADHPLAVLGQRLFTARRLRRAWTDTIAPTTTTRSDERRFKNSPTPSKTNTPHLGRRGSARCCQMGISSCTVWMAAVGCRASRRCPEDHPVRSLTIV